MERALRLLEGAVEAAFPVMAGAGRRGLEVAVVDGAGGGTQRRPHLVAEGADFVGEEVATRLTIRSFVAP